MLKRIIVGILIALTIVSLGVGIQKSLRAIKEVKDENTKIEFKSYKIMNFEKNVVKKQQEVIERLKIEEEERLKIEEEERRRKEEESRILVELSFYTSTYEECLRTDGLTASGAYATPYYTIAMDESIPFGTLVEIDGFGIMENQDTGGEISYFYNEEGKKVYNVDVYLGYDTEKAFKLGRYITHARILD